MPAARVPRPTMNPFQTLMRSVMAACLLAVPPAIATAADFDVRTANMRRVGDDWTLTARIDYQLTGKAEEALDNGVTLTFSVELSVERQRSWWTDPEVLAKRLDWKLAFDPLTKRYLVRYPDEREPTSHGTLFGALNAIGRVQSLVVGPGSALEKGETYDVAVRAVLDQRTLPGALQVFAFWSGGFSLESGWYEWTMSP